MEANKLMIGDWVYDNDYPMQITEIKFRHRGEPPYKLIGSLRRGGLEMENISLDYTEPIPLTPEILEKNGFIKGDTMDLGDGIYCVKLFNIHYDNEERQFWVCNFFESEYGKEMMDIFRIDYVHELQHALRLCKIEKEIVV